MVLIYKTGLSEFIYIHFHLMSVELRGTRGEV